MQNFAAFVNVVATHQWSKIIVNNSSSTKSYLTKNIFVNDDKLIQCSFLHKRFLYVGRLTSQIFSWLKSTDIVCLRSQNIFVIIVVSNWFWAFHCQNNINLSFHNNFHHLSTSRLLFYERNSCRHTYVTMWHIKAMKMRLKVLSTCH